MPPLRPSPPAVEPTATSILVLRSPLAIREGKGCGGGSKDEKVGKETKKAPPLPVLIVTAVLNIDMSCGLCSSNRIRRRRAERYVQVYICFLGVSFNVLLLSGFYRSLWSQCAGGSSWRHGVQQRGRSTWQCAQCMQGAWPGPRMCIGCLGPCMECHAW